MKTFFKTGGISRQDYDNAETSFKVAEANWNGVFFDIVDTGGIDPSEAGPGHRALGHERRSAQGDRRRTGRRPAGHRHQGAPGQGERVPLPRHQGPAGRARHGEAADHPARLTVP